MRSISPTHPVTQRLFVRPESVPLQGEELCCMEALVHPMLAQASLEWISLAGIDVPTSKTITKSIIVDALKVKILS